MCIGSIDLILIIMRIFIISWAMKQKGLGLISNKFNYLICPEEVDNTVAAVIDFRTYLGPELFKDEENPPKTLVGPSLKDLEVCDEAVRRLSYEIIKKYR